MDVRRGCCSLGVTGHCESPNITARNQTWLHTIPVPTCSLRAISPTPGTSCNTRVVISRPKLSFNFNNPIINSQILTRDSLGEATLILQKGLASSSQSRKNNTLWNLPSSILPVTLPMSSWRLDSSYSSMLTCGILLHVQRYISVFSPFGQTLALTLLTRQLISAITLIASGIGQETHCWLLCKRFPRIT